MAAAFGLILLAVVAQGTAGRFCFDNYEEKSWPHVGADVGMTVDWNIRNSRHKNMKGIGSSRHGNAKELSNWKEKWNSQIRKTWN